ncbi:MAG TPA: hypothetical protein VI977_06090 [archaeon]|nr:hypothetical protein [archaeon]
MPKGKKLGMRPVDARVRKLFEARKGTKTFYKAAHVQISKHLLAELKLTPQQMKKALPLMAQQYLIWEAQGPVSAAVARIICRRAIAQLPVFVEFVPTYADAAKSEKKSIEEFLQKIKGADPRQQGYILEPLLTRFEAYNRAAIVKVLGRKKGEKYLRAHDEELKKIAHLMAWKPSNN